MLFQEPLFLFLFLPCTFALHQLTRSLAVLLAASLVFYAWGEPAFVPVAIASALLDYWLGGQIARGRRWALPGGVAANLALLVTYKYLGFVLANLAPATLRVPAIALPIGVSFIVFEKITYLVDISRGASPLAPSLVRYLAYVFLFPKLLAGPIVKYHEIEAQLREPRRASLDDVADGFLRFMLGFIKKLLLADVLAAAADAAFALPPGDLGFAQAWAGVALFTLEIYLDFSAYSDMAIGLARMFGFRLPENFDQPYTARSVTEFWRRWHISLTGWIREYLYVPLGGNRRGPARTWFNLWVCFLASGLWHGAAWTYVLWGAYHGAFLVLDRLFLLRLLSRLPRVAATASTLAVVMVGWAIFRAGSLGQAAALLGTLADPLAAGLPVVWENDTRLAFAAGAAIALGPRLPGRRMLALVPGRFAAETAALLLFALALGKAVADPFRPFLYFRF